MRAADPHDDEAYALQSAQQVLAGNGRQVSTQGKTVLGGGNRDRDRFEPNGRGVTRRNVFTLGAALLDAQLDDLPRHRERFLDARTPRVGLRQRRDDHVVRRPLRFGLQDDRVA